MRPFTVNQETIDALAKYPNLAALLELQVGYSKLAIVGRLNKSFVKPVDLFLQYLDHWAMEAAPIVKLVLAAKAETQFGTLLPEL